MGDVKYKDEGAGRGVRNKDEGVGCRRRRKAEEEWPGACKIAKTRNDRHIMREGRMNKDEGAIRSDKHEDEGAGLDDRVQGAGAGLDDNMQGVGAGLDDVVQGKGAGLNDMVQGAGEELDLYSDTGSSTTSNTPAMNLIDQCISISVAVNDGYSVLMSLWEQQITSAKYPHTIISHHRVITNKT